MAILNIFQEVKIKFEDLKAQMFDISRSIMNSRRNIEKIESYYRSVGQKLPPEVINVRSELNNNEIQYFNLESILKPILRTAGVETNFGALPGILIGVGILIGIPTTAYLILASLRTKARQTELKIDAIAKGILPAMVDWPTMLNKAIPYTVGGAIVYILYKILKR